MFPSEKRRVGFGPRCEKTPTRILGAFVPAETGGSVQLSLATQASGHQLGDVTVIAATFSTSTNECRRAAARSERRGLFPTADAVG
jgi:hypothetical protein